MIQLFEPSEIGVWNIDANQYPKTGSDEQKLRFLLNYAILAPSTFNSQPWKINLTGRQIKVYVDYGRLTKRSDKTGRFGVISIGSFIQNLIIAGKYFHWDIDVQLSNEELEKNDLIATLDFAPSKNTAHSENSVLFGQITKRATNRSLSLDFNLDQESIDKLNSFVGKNQQIHILPREEYDQQLKDISYQADLNIWSDKEFRKEHVQWVRNNATKQPDGMPGYGVGVKLLPSFLAKPVILSNRFATFQAAKNLKSLDSSRYYLVISSPDGKPNWVRNGQLFMNCSLYLAELGLSASPMGQFIENHEARDKLQNLISSKNPPQMFIRLNKPSESVKHSPRMSVDAIMRV